MIELVNVTRTYKPKRGVPVKALDGVSVKFQEKGMVFVLGKSGSGKSTLLNIIGGLDKYDAGDLIIKGKSTQNFRQQDFDSYRNTMIGFIFQEYNVLDEFTVAQNIGLALELQGKKITGDAINHILESVDLVGFGDRKPNELSGGQKQRVAIARALVKDPKIIMADEPTGALDSDTGKQVFETLKKLSKEKLVIIVSHDRDFAEKYGLRVIEFKDGKIIRDVTRVSQAETDLAPITFGEEGMKIASGYQLTVEDLNVINAYLAKTKSETTVSTDTHAKNTVNTSSFVQTDSAKIQSNHEPYEVIKSRLPFKASLKMGASALKHKRIRLVFSIILAAFALVLFGLSDTLGSYDKYTATTRSMKDSDVNYLAFDKIYMTRHDNGYSYSRVNLDQEDVKYLNSINSKVKFKPIYNDHNLSYQAYELTGNDDYQRKLITSYGNFSGAMFLDQEDIEKYGFSLTGSLPQERTEIAVSSYLLEVYKQYGYRNETDGKKIVIRQAQDLIGKTISMNVNGNAQSTFKIVGVVDTKLDIDRYNKKIKEDIGGYFIYNEFNNLLQYTYHNALFTTDKFFNQIPSNIVVRYDYSYYGDFPLNVYQETQQEVTYLSGFTKADLKGNHALISYNTLRNLVDNYELYQLILNNTKIDLQNDSAKRTEIKQIVDEANGQQSNQDDEQYIRDYASIISNKPDHVDYMKALTTALKKLTTTLRNNTSDIKIIGFTNDEQQGILMSKESINSLIEEKQSNIGIKSIIAPINNLSESELLAFVKLHYQDEGMVYQLKNSISSTLDDINSMVESMATGFLYIGIGFAVFASLLMLNFISASVSYKKKEIGILRAIGARGKDVLSIFSKEALIIALINYVLAMIGVVVGITLLNNMMRNDYGILITILNLGIRQFALVLFVSITVAFIAAAIPVLSIAHKRPIDAIRDK